LGARAAFLSGTVALAIAGFTLACPAPANGERDAGERGDGDDAGASATDAGSNATDAGVVDAGPAEPIDAPSGSWTFVGFPGSACDDGSATGIGINPSTSTSNVMIFFDGGGACFDYETCFVLNTASHGPFGATELAALASNSPAGTIFDRSDANNPFASWSFVFIPYCTGDLHSGDVVRTYSSGSTSKTFAHVGHKNVLAFLPRLAATFPAIDKLAVTGSSAGGGGAVINYPDITRALPATTAMLVDDSLPFFEHGVIADSYLEEQITAWDSASLMTAICGAPCDTNESQIYTGLAALFPTDRMAFLSSEQDQTISAFDLLNATQFQTALDALVSDVIAPSTTWKSYRIGGNTHTMLGAVTLATTSDGTSLETWLAQMVDGDPAWTSAGP
jgi:hypothetical protein